jgi:signal transduction histidine kinase
MTAAATDSLPQAGLTPVFLRERVRATPTGGADDAEGEAAALLDRIATLLSDRNLGAEARGHLAAARRRALAIAPTSGIEGSVVSFVMDIFAGRERSLVDASERRLTRLAFDLHDGPVQDVVALAAEVRLLRQELVDESEQPAGRGSVAARFDALEAQLLEVGRELREVSSSLEPTKALRSVRDGLASHIEAFRTQTEIQATLELAGDFESLTASQRIAALRIVQEALANVREHSGATHVRVAASATDGFVRIEVADDGRGFDVERTGAKAAKDGRLGLVGMSERVRLLGGRLDIHSRPGGPTTISAVLRQWRPAEPTEDALAEASWALAAEPSAPAIR